VKEREMSVFFSGGNKKVPPFNLRVIHSLEGFKGSAALFKLNIEGDRWQAGKKRPFSST